MSDLWIVLAASGHPLPEVTRAPAGVGAFLQSYPQHRVFGVDHGGYHYRWWGP